MSDRPLLVACNLRKRYAKNADFLLDVDKISIDKGKLVILAGANGAGKSSLLKILAGLINAEDGCEYFWKDQSISKPAIGAKVAYLHQNPYLFATTTYNNVKLALQYHKLPLTHAITSLAWAGLDKVADQFAPTLSGGQQRRLALARLHACPAPLLLLDEPTSQLDEEGREVVADLLVGLIDENRSVLVSTHDARLINKFPSAEVINIIKGEIIPK